MLNRPIINKLTQKSKKNPLIEISFEIMLVLFGW